MARPLFGTTGISLARPGGSLGCLLPRRVPQEPLRASGRRRFNRPVAEPEAHRVLIQPRQCGGLVENTLLGCRLPCGSLCSKQREAPAVQDGGIYPRSKQREAPAVQDGGIYSL